MNGQITVLGGLVFGVIVSLMLVMIESAVCAAAKTRINSVVNLGVQSLFSQYSRPVLDEYEIFGGVISSEEEVLRNLNDYIEENISINNMETTLRGSFDPCGIRLRGLEIDEYSMLTDKNGEFFYDEIVEYMKYGQFDNSLMEFVPEMLETSKQKGIDEVSEELAARQKEAGKIDGKILKVLMHVEGVKTTSSGFKQFFGKLTSAETFVKKICPNGTGFGQTGVQNRQIYDAVSERYYDITSELESLKGELDLIINIYNNPFTKGIFMDAGFRNQAFQILSEINDTAVKIEMSLKLIEEIESDTGKLMNNLKQSQIILDANRENLKEDVAGAFEQEFAELEKYKTGNANSLCDIGDIKQKLLNSQEILLLMQEAVGTLANEYMDIDSIGDMYEKVNYCIEICKIYNASDIQFNYEGISLGKGKSIEILEKIKKAFSNNILKFVVEDEKNISKKKINYVDLSSKKCSYDTHNWRINVNFLELYRDFLYNKYVNLNFSSYRNPKTNGLLEYEMEYVLGKSDSDRENLKEVVMQLTALRFTFNFSYIICDVNKKTECMEMATAMLGFTGVYGIIKAGQFLLLMAWSYGEAVNDVKILMKGGRVPLKKTIESWKTGLADIIENQISENKEDNANGLIYEEYLQLLLFLRNKNIKIFRTMDMMEINMIRKGYSHIRMYRYLYSIKGEALFIYRNGRYEYGQEFEFQY